MRRLLRLVSALALHHIQDIRQTAWRGIQRCTFYEDQQLMRRAAGQATRTAALTAWGLLFSMACVPWFALTWLAGELPYQVRAERERLGQVGRSCKEQPRNGQDPTETV